MTVVQLAAFYYAISYLTAGALLLRGVHGVFALMAGGLVGGAAIAASVLMG